MNVSFSWSTVALGLMGAAVPEVLRAIAALRLGKAPGRKEIIASLLTVLLGLGVLLLDTKDDSALEIAVLGAAFPQLFSGLVAAAGKRKDGDGTNTDFSGESAPRTTWDYLGWRL